MTSRRVKVVAAIANLALLGLTGFTVTRGVELEGTDVVLFLLMVLTPVISLVALYWPNQPQPAESARGARMEDRR
jgi:hypothetical protein